MLLTRTTATPFRKTVLVLTAFALLSLAVAGNARLAAGQSGDRPLEAATTADLGTYLTGEHGMTLYFFTKDHARDCTSG